MAQKQLRKLQRLLSVVACIPLAGIASVGVKYTGKATDATLTLLKNSRKADTLLDSKKLLKNSDGLFAKLFKKADGAAETENLRLITGDDWNNYFRKTYVISNQTVRNTDADGEKYLFWYTEM